MQRIREERFEYRDTFDEILEEMEVKSGYSVLWPKTSLDAVVADLCPFRSVPSFTVNLPNTMYVQKNWPYKDLINYQ